MKPISTLLSYTLSYPQRHKHLVDIELTWTAQSTKTELCLAYWRPGRYEAQKFPQRILFFKAKNSLGQTLPWKKISTHVWEIEHASEEKIRVSYSYDASQLDAGGSWVDIDLIYLNPVNCFFYLKEACAFEVKLELPLSYRYAGGLPLQEACLKAQSFEELADHPWLASPQLQKISYIVGVVEFNIWSLQGFEDRDKIIKDFEAFTQVQIDTMGSFPEKDYHFLLISPAHPAYHGVEHRNSTVLYLGPAQKVASMSINAYASLLELASHELFHAWNICKIRPAELMPYTYEEPVYFQTCYVAEGVTTYYGDLFLAKSKVYTDAQVLVLLQETIQRHLENPARHHTSLTQSSFDLWVDGYQPSNTNRKVSVYDAGALAAWILDLLIREASADTASLDDVMRTLWQDFGQKQIGYTEQDYQSLAEKKAGKMLPSFWKEVIHGEGQIEHWLHKVCALVGLVLVKETSRDFWKANFGIYLRGNQIFRIDSNSLPDRFLAEGDVIVQVQGKPFSEFDAEKNGHLQTLAIQVQNAWGVKEVMLLADGLVHFPDYVLYKASNATEEEKARYGQWMGHSF